MKRYGNFYVSVADPSPCWIHIQPCNEDGTNDGLWINLHPDEIMDLQAVIDWAKLEVKRKEK